MKLISFRSLLLASAFVVALGACRTPSESTLSFAISNPDTLDAILNKFVDNEGFPFIYARLEDKEGNVIYEHSTVNRRVLPDKEINGDTWIRIWSMSKIVTISMVMDLVEDGLISLDDPVVKYIPEFENLQVAVNNDGQDLSVMEDKSLACPIMLVPLDSVMTVLHLLNHQAGFYYSVTGIQCLDSMARAKNLPGSVNTDEIIAKMSELPLVQQPGTNYFYGTNTSVLGFVAERATGKSLKQLIEERVTGPMGIKGLQYDLPQGAEMLPRFSGKDSLIREATRGELDIFGEDVPDYDPAHELYLGGEGMIATADAYADFTRMLLNYGQLNGYQMLDRETVEDIASPHTLTDSPYGYNGYNLWVSGDSSRINGQGDSGLWIGGGYEGTHFWIDPKRDFVGVVMTQMFWTPESGWGRDNEFKGELYRQIFAQEEASIE